MPSELQLTLCVPDVSPNSTPDISTIREFMGSVSAFFLKFPLRYEVLLAVSKPSDELRAAVSDQKLASDERNPFRIVEMTGLAHARSKKLKTLFTEAKGEVVVATSVHLEIPLGDIFKMLQELYTDPELQAVFGHRSAKRSAGAKTSAQVGPSSATLPHALQSRDPLEVFFQNIAFEKVRWPFKDLFCPTFALRKSAFEKIGPELKTSGWHWTMEVQRSVTRMKLKATEVPVIENLASNLRSTKHVHGFRRALEALRLLSFVVFRI